MIGCQKWNCSLGVPLLPPSSQPGSAAGIECCGHQNVVVLIAKYICPNCKMYLSKLKNMFLQIAKCICLNFQWFLPRLLLLSVDQQQEVSV